MQVNEKSDARFDETRRILSKLGLSEYEKNFKKGLIYDEALPLLTERQVLTKIFI